MIVKMDRPRGATGAPTVCMRQGCENPLTQTPGGGPPRRYCSDACRSADRRERQSRADADPAEIVPLSVVQEQGEASAVVELRALSARLAQLADAVDATLVDAEVDAVAARVASVEAVAAEHVAERHAADERQAGLAAEEAAEVAEDLASAAQRERDQAIAEATALAARALEAEERASAEVERLRTLLEAATTDAEVRIGQALADAAERVERANARADQVRADADARIDAERTARVAAQSLADAMAGERDRLMVQADRDAASLAALARALQAVEDRAGGGSARSSPPSAG
jgi:hypothetical protein